MTIRICVVLINNNKVYQNAANLSFSNAKILSQVPLTMDLEVYFNNVDILPKTQIHSFLRHDAI